ncbi:hypothetical protein [Nitrogeniibacter aestuarii]|uniref:hypothetical protein n=1 Tax=Nitrogeniibacter aestuarii TaxID=2815343 RepID=UPI001E4AAB43|nr:hypothetical protein [Nitrogeniibacter aestuarii]
MNPICRFYRSATPTGAKIIVTCLMLGVLSTVPLWLSLGFGLAGEGAATPGVIAMFGTIFSGLGAAIGALWLVVSWLWRRRAPHSSE